MASIDWGVLPFIEDGLWWIPDEKYPEIKIGDYVVKCYSLRCDVYRAKTGVKIAEFLTTKRLDALGHMKKGSCMSARYQIGPLRMHFKELLPLVWQLKIDANGKHYTIIYGQGITADPFEWCRHKNTYLGKRGARIVDNAIRRTGKWRYWR